MNRIYLLIGVCAVAAATTYSFLPTDPVDDDTPSPASDVQAMVAATMPAIGGDAASGQRIFEANCAKCHGTGATGNKEAGPPLIHIIYEPGHHGDESFQRAVALGVRSHHWRFGNMPPVEGLAREDVSLIIAYIREIQRANGIN